MVNQNNLTPVKTIKGKENEKKETVVVSTPLKKVTVIAQDEEVWDLFTSFFFKWLLCKGKIVLKRKMNIGVFKLIVKGN